MSAPRLDLGELRRIFAKSRKAPLDLTDAEIDMMEDGIPLVLSIAEAAEAWQKDEAVGAPRLRAALAAVRKEEQHGAE